MFIKHCFSTLFCRTIYSKSLSLIFSILWPFFFIICSFLQVLNKTIESWQIVLYGRNGYSTSISLRRTVDLNCKLFSVEKVILLCFWKFSLHYRCYRSIFQSDGLEIQNFGKLVPGVNFDRFCSFFCNFFSSKFNESRPYLLCMQQISSVLTNTYKGGGRTICTYMILFFQKKKRFQFLHPPTVSVSHSNFFRGNRPSLFPIFLSIQNLIIRKVLVFLAVCVSHSFFLWEWEHCIRLLFPTTKPFLNTMSQGKTCCIIERFMFFLKRF